MRKTLLLAFVLSCNLSYHIIFLEISAQDGDLEHWLSKVEILAKSTPGFNLLIFNGNLYAGGHHV